MQPYNPAFLQLIILFAYLIVAVLFLLTQHNTVLAVRKENRLLRPGLIWVQLIPGIGQIWQFSVVTYIADSIRKEFASRQDDSVLGVTDAGAVAEWGKRPTYGIGIAYCTLSAATVLIKIFGSGIDMRMFAGLCSLAAIVCWIIYWIQLAGYKRKLQALRQ